MILNRLTYREKTRIAVAGFVVFLLISYLYAFEKTLFLFNDNRRLHAALRKADNAPREIMTLERALNNAREHLSGGRGMVARPAENLLEFVSVFCQQHQIILKEFPERVLSQAGDVTLSTQSFTVEGNFKSLVSLVYALEKGSELGRVVSNQYRSHFDVRRKTTILSLTVYIQNVVPTHES